MNVYLVCVKLQLKRIQTYLFSDSPKLKAMIGANSILGEVARGRFADQGNGFEFIPKVSQNKKLKTAEIDNLPALAVACGSKNAASLLSDSIDWKRYSQWFGFDFLSTDALLERSPDDVDDPISFVKEFGILSRDGGHLEALFEASLDVETNTVKSPNAIEFLKQAKHLLRTRLPGVHLQTDTLVLCQQNDSWKLATKSDQKPLQLEQHDPPQLTGSSLANISLFQVCQQTGNQVAADTEHDEHVSQSTIIKHEQAKQFENDRTFDLVNIAKREIQSRLQDEQNNLANPKFPTEFADVASISDYLAVVVSDGNGMGVRCGKLRDLTDVCYFERHFRVEQIYFQMRVLVRYAVSIAIEKTFGKSDTKGMFPFRLLMLGGDDFLFVCDAVYALQFVKCLCEQLPKVNLADGRPLTLGTGVAIVPAKFPFHRAHELAEELASSAKKFFRCIPEGNQCSVVDWVSLSEGWHDDIATTRRKDFQISYRLPGITETKESLFLTSKPYRVALANGAGSENGNTLEKLLQVAETTSKQISGDGKFARTQLKTALESLRKGKRTADFAYAGLPKPMRTTLSAITDDADTPWGLQQN